MSYEVYIAKAVSEKFDFNKIEFFVIGNCRIPEWRKLPEPLCNKEDVYDLYWEIVCDNGKPNAAVDYPNASMVKLSKAKLIKRLNQEKYKKVRGGSSEISLDTFCEMEVQAVKRLSDFAELLPDGEYVLVAAPDKGEIKRRREDEEAWRDAMEIFDK